MAYTWLVYIWKYVQECLLSLTAYIFFVSVGAWNLSSRGRYFGFHFVLFCWDIGTSQQQPHWHVVSSCCINFTTRTNTKHKLITKVVSVGGSSMCSLQLTWFFSRSRISWRARSMMHWPAQRAKPHCWIDVFWVFRVTQCLWRMDLWKWSGANMKLDFLQCVHLIFWPNIQMKLAFGLVSLIRRGGTKSIYVQWFSVRFLRSATKLNVRAVNHQFFNQPVGRVWGTNVGKGLGRDLLHVAGLFDPSLGIATLPATCQL